MCRLPQKKRQPLSRRRPLLQSEALQLHIHPPHHLVLSKHHRMGNCYHHCASSCVHSKIVPWSVRERVRVREIVCVLVCLQLVWWQQGTLSFQFTHCSLSSHVLAQMRGSVFGGLMLVVLGWNLQFCMRCALSDLLSRNIVLWVVL